MAEGISEVLTFAIGVAMSPLAVIAVILVLVSRRARTNGSLFLLGWVLALALVSGVVYAVSHDAYEADPSAASDGIAWGLVALGAVLLVMALRSWHRRPSPGSAPELPTWLASADDLTPPRAFGLAVLFAGVKPKNLILTVGAAGGLARLDLSPSEAATALAVFLVVASLSVGVPVLAFLAGGRRAEATLDSVKSWLLAHHAAMMTALLLVFGVYLIADGVGILGK
jgi:Sap, sulfolipid-1-addressing protein